MCSVVIAELGLAARIARVGIMNHIDEEDLKLHMPDLCYDYNSSEINNDKVVINSLVKDKKLEIINLSEAEMRETGKIKKVYYPKIMLKSAATIVLAKTRDLIIVTENDLLRELSFKDHAINCFDKAWLINHIISRLKRKGNTEFEGILKLV